MMKYFFRQLEFLSVLKGFLTLVKFLIVRTKICALFEEKVTAPRQI